MIPPAVALPLTIATLLVAAAAFWRGGWPEKAVAWGTLGAMIATPIVPLYRLGHPDYHWFIIDVLLLALVAGVALKSNRWWPLFFCAFLLIDAVTRVGSVAGVAAMSALRGPAGLAWITACLAAQAAGVIEARRRSRRAAA